MPLFPKKMTGSWGEFDEKANICYNNRADFSIYSQNVRAFACRVRVVSVRAPLWKGVQFDLSRESGGMGEL